MPSLMAAHLMKIYSGRQYTYTHTIFARLSDVLILDTWGVYIWRWLMTRVMRGEWQPWRHTWVQVFHFHDFVFAVLPYISNDSGNPVSIFSPLLLLCFLLTFTRILFPSDVYVCPCHSLTVIEQANVFREIKAGGFLEPIRFSPVLLYWFLLMCLLP
jgi:hypothetical protein